MSEDTELLEKREELKRQLKDGEYKLLAAVVLDKVGRAIQKLTRNPEPLSPWYSAALITFLLVSLRLLTLLTQNVFDDLLMSGFVFPFLAEIVLAGFTMNVIGIFTRMVFGTFCESTLDGVQSVQDLKDLHNWLAAVSTPRRQMLFSLLCILYYLVTFLPSLISDYNVSPTFGLWVSSIVFAILFSFPLYHIYWYIALTLRLRQYHFKLYPANPSRSTVIAKLSDTLGTIVFFAAALAALLTLIDYLWTPEPDPAFVLAVWAALFAGFVVYQRALARIITRAKWRTLDDIQSKVERLQTMQDIPDEKALAQMNKLMDYHDRIEATPNSLFNLREGIKLVNALLLPLAAFVLGNIDQMLAWFRP